MKRHILQLIVLGMAVAAGSVRAQNADAPKSGEPLKFYKLEFVVKEIEGGKVVNSRAYSMTAAAGLPGQQMASIRTGSKVPVASGGTQGGQFRQFQYIDVGVNIDCRSITEVQRDLSLNVTADIASVPSEQAAPASAGDMMPPIIRQNKWSSWVIVPLRKPTVLFSSDDLPTKRQMQLELTATPVQ